MVNQLVDFIELLEDLENDNTIDYKTLQKAVESYQTGLRIVKKQLIKHRFTDGLDTDPITSYDLWTLEKIAGKHFKEAASLINHDPSNYIDTFYEELMKYDLTYIKLLNSLSYLQEGLALVHSTLAKDKSIVSEHILDASVMSLYKAFAGL